MKGKYITTIGITWILLLLLVSPLTVTLVNASGESPASILHACDANPTTINELKNVYWAFEDIYDIFAERYHYHWVWYYYPYIGFWVKGDPVYGHLTNSMVWNGGDPYSTTTENGVLNGIEDVNENHEYSSFLYVGHGGRWYWWGSHHYSFFMNGKGLNIGGGQVPSVSDALIYAAGDVYPADNHHFVFLWTCFNGYERGSENNPPYIPPNGMPHCWTDGQIGQSTNGYASPDGSDYCFIGFHMASPRLEEPHNGANHLYKHWLVFFYYYAVQHTSQYSVKQALDYASQAQGFDDFTETRLYKKGPNYPYSGGNPAYEDTYFLGLPDPKNPGEWLIEEGWYDTWIRVYGDGDYEIPGDIYDY
ncbi:MAG TPA: hypothetical protein ENN36_01540 [Candidatus Bathyarchaeota archaeon]|nr:hypothetical protein [Candidatus Bathyarchaeota archaeon]